MEELHHMLVCTVGGTKEAIIAAILHWKPAKTLFLPSEQTRSDVDAIASASNLTPGSWEALILSDAQDFSNCVSQMKRLDERITQWSRRGPGYDVVVDFTGGTKCMSAALSLVSRRWPCAFSYVGGSERTKGGTGIVVSGKEQVVFTQNPWNALGYQAIEDACLLFDEQDFTAAGTALDETRKRVDDRSTNRTLSTLHRLCEAYGLWDRFQHHDAINAIEDVLKNANDLRVALGADHSEPVLRSINHNHRALRQIVGRPQSRAMVADLLANAGRRKREGRYDDGVARLYRAIESLGQIALAERHGISDTGKVSLENIPESLRERWSPRAEDGKLRLGLQNVYELLACLGDEIAETFRKLELHDRIRSPLSARNESILAHGFTPATAKDFNRLWSAALQLGDFSEDELPVFPSLSKTPYN
jgi:CRISPR-associated protein (TIGR02710 family)